MIECYLSLSYPIFEKRDIMKLKKENIIEYILDVIIILLCISFIIVLIINNSNNKIPEETTIDDIVASLSGDIFDEQLLNGLKFSTSPVVGDDTKGYRIEVRVTNTNDYVFALNGFSVLAYDEDHNLVSSVHNFQRASIEANDSILYILECDKDFLQDNYTLEYRPSYIKESQNEKKDN